MAFSLQQRAALRWVLRIVAILAVAYGLHLLMQAAMGWVETFEGSSRRVALSGLFVIALLAYGVLVAVPFVPGIEIGLSLLMLSGAAIAPFVYTATVIGLMLAFAVGRWLPENLLVGLFYDLKLRRTAVMISRVAELNVEERLTLLQERLPRRLAPSAIGLRYPVIAVLVNLPGNSLIGGGGGILMVAGMSRLFSAPGMVLTLAIACAPVPLAVWLWGDRVLQWLG